ncbi:hypothetical protein EDF57_103522 [Novosphingobium sp. PhB55]|uniref:hypothetical protein n=1 Tax=Novosphingobium sp. PhB55 TaxID=2485106 RepID=UPI001066FD43|nr:hypothetical protein [Novosphingobium sp. PhB55]TDW65338.1 hypothetical protein EDF57_103522 [Novosphingobium sp. PhB55]
MATLSAPDYWADVMRWWAFVGAPLGAVPLARKLREMATLWHIGLREPVTVPLKVLLLAGGALLCFLCFSFVAGLVIPFTNRLPGFDMQSIIFRAVMAGAWTMAGIASWLSAVAFARGRWFMAGAAATWFVAVSFVTVATAG